jgi:primosomal protein N'
MLFRCERRGELKRLLTALRESLEASASRKVRWAIDVDPPGLA